MGGEGKGKTEANWRNHKSAAGERLYTRFRALRIMIRNIFTQLICHDA